MTGAVLKPVIGLEVHAQLLTKSKMFCACSAAYSGASPNTHVCAVCSGMPGALPMINGRAVEMAILTALALDCDIPPMSKFDRKNYHYPDLPKGYQISQYDQPLGRGGRLEYSLDGQRKQCGIVRVHLEEDTGKLLHTLEAGRDVSLIDYNRSGVPLMEIVSEPELHSPAEAREYFESLRRLLMYLAVCDGNLEEGSLRADVNVSLRADDGAFGTKVEIKNLNSFRAVERALDYEIGRQAELLASGARLEQETRGWVERGEITVSQRTKEYAHDYRYFPEPDLPLLQIGEEVRERMRRAIPELPMARASRFLDTLGLPADLSRLLASEKSLGDYFEDAVGQSGAPPRQVANWIVNELMGRLRERRAPLAGGPISPDRLGRLVALVDSGAIGGPAAKRVLDTMLESDESPDAIVERLDLRPLGEDADLYRMVEEIVAGNPTVVADYRAGKTRAADALVGKTMAATKGRADARKIRALVERALSGD